MVGHELLVDAVLLPGSVPDPDTAKAFSTRRLVDRDRHPASAVLRL